MRAARAGVELLALTDHDTVGGVSEALGAGERWGVRVVPAIEISAVDLTCRRELHILGYCIDHTSTALLKSLVRFRADREQRTLRMARALAELGFELDEHEIAARRAAGLPIGRPHLAKAMLACPSNAARLHDEGVDDVGSLINGHLSEGAPAFVERQTPTVAEAVETIHGAGGVAIWAHPFWDVADPIEVLACIDRLRTLGIDGVETFYLSHTREQTDLLVERCEKLGLLSTGSADFHGPESHPFSRFLDFDTFGHEPNLGPIRLAGSWLANGR